ncbi:hypothetical protein Ate02nite_84820 [Paractinoplanes tereljensis]|uniref:Uncharacterized protein n=1 Tax=Paractinoplanes tereljensis TaxID=571912 RepID=A0A919NYN9_9ACTN|nr:hypothetical protein Ate02nite_84820 [Actinoplanes tereljensis]
MDRNEVVVAVGLQTDAVVVLFVHVSKMRVTSDRSCCRLGRWSASGRSAGITQPTIYRLRVEGGERFRAGSRLMLNAAGVGDVARAA